MARANRRGNPPWARALGGDGGRPAVRRVHIIGPPGSGKTRLGRELARWLDVPFYSLDDILLGNVADDVKDLVRSYILAQEAFVTEGIYYWPAALERVEVVVVLSPARWRRTYRVVVRRFLGRALTKMWQGVWNLGRTLSTNWHYEQRQMGQSVAYLRAHQREVLMVRDGGEAVERLRDYAAPDAGGRGTPDGGGRGDP